MDKDISLKLRTISTKPGVYCFINSVGTVIYIGKAKNLKKRVSSYFTKKHDSAKLRVLVTKIADIRTTVVDTEWEALLLENSLIKQYQPRYNSMLKDDKSYPWISVTREQFPRVFSTRHPNAEQTAIYGPFASVRYMNTLLDTIHEIFLLRTCRRLPKDRRPCIQYQIKRCTAPCAGYISVEEYNKNVDKAVEVIEGNSREVIKQMQDEMMEFARQLEFEKAQFIKEKIEILETFRGKSVVVNPKITKVDVFTIVEDDDSAYINFLRITEGAIVQIYTLEINNKLNKTSEELLWMGMIEIHKRFKALNKDILVPFLPKMENHEFTFFVPQRGDKKKLLDLSTKNATVFMLEKFKRKELLNPERHQQRVLQSLQKELSMKKLPRHIECFDNSNFQGDDAVSAMVCFINGKPQKKEYRHFNIKSVVGPNDYASMEEVVYRRYKRLLEEQKELPDLIIIDGGKGQLHVAYQALQKLKIEKEVTLIGIAERLEDIYKIGDPLPLYLDKKSEAQKLIQKIRDEAHRFGLAHHRKKKIKTSLSSILTDIEGISTISAQKLLQHFKSVKRISEAKEDEIAEVIGKSKARKVYTFFKKVE